MDIKIFPSQLKGNVCAIPSKSQAHRILICAAFSDEPTRIHCHQTNQDMDATVRCLEAIGATIKHTGSEFLVVPIAQIPSKAEMDCGESGSTLRFILPIVCALGIQTTIHMAGRLPERPLSPLWEELERMGCVLTKPTSTVIQTSGKLQPGFYSIAGNISSQFITGLLFALSLLEGESQIKIIGTLESKPYVDMTLNVLHQFGVVIEDLHVRGSYPFRSPNYTTVEGDWSNAAFFLAAKALGHDISVTNLDPNSSQGDRRIASILCDPKPRIIDAADIPDLIPILSVFFAANQGAVFQNITRLRLKESDRVASVCEMLKCFGIETVSDQSTLSVSSGVFHGCTINAYGDHRIAMTAAIAATLADGPVTILGAQCVAKSYPTFWQEFQRLGGKYEQYIW